MKRMTLAILAIIFSVAVFAGEPTDIKVMSYNLRFGELSPMEEIGRYIASEAPDIVALQECDWNTARERAPKQNGVRFVNVLASETGMFGLYGKSIDYKGGYYGIGILSKYPIVRSERVLLPNDGKTEQRSMLVADIEMPGGKIITFVCTHLEVSSSEMRVRQVKFINKYLSKVKNQIILAGDMNAEPDSEEMALLRKSWKDLTDREFTYHSSKPSIKIDYVYSKPAEKVELMETEVCKEVKLSDHFPVMSYIKIK